MIVVPTFEKLDATLQMVGAHVRLYRKEMDLLQNPTIILIYNLLLVCILFFTVIIAEIPPISSATTTEMAPTATSQGKATLLIM